MTAAQTVLEEYNNLVADSGRSPVRVEQIFKLIRNISPAVAIGPFKQYGPSSVLPVILNDSSVVYYQTNKATNTYGLVPSGTVPYNLSKIIANKHLFRIRDEQGNTGVGKVTQNNNIYEFEDISNIDEDAYLLIPQNQSLQELYEKSEARKKQYDFKTFAPDELSGLSSVRTISDMINKHSSSPYYSLEDVLVERGKIVQNAVKEAVNLIRRDLPTSDSEFLFNNKQRLQRLKDELEYLKQYLDECQKNDINNSNLKELCDSIEYSIKNVREVIQLNEQYLQGQSSRLKSLMSDEGEAYSSRASVVHSQQPEFIGEDLSSIIMPLGAVLGVERTRHLRFDEEQRKDAIYQLMSPIRAPRILFRGETSFRTTHNLPTFSHNWNEVHQGDVLKFDSYTFCSSDIQEAKEYAKGGTLLIFYAPDGTPIVHTRPSHKECNLLDGTSVRVINKRNQIIEQDGEPVVSQIVELQIIGENVAPQASIDDNLYQKQYSSDILKEYNREVTNPINRARSIGALFKDPAYHFILSRNKSVEDVVHSLLDLPDLDINNIYIGNTTKYDTGKFDSITPVIFDDGSIMLLAKHNIAGIGFRFGTPTDTYVENIKNLHQDTSSRDYLPVSKYSSHNDEVEYGSLNDFGVNLLPRRPVSTIRSIKEDSSDQYVTASKILNSNIIKTIESMQDIRDLSFILSSDTDKYGRHSEHDDFLSNPELEDIGTVAIGDAVDIEHNDRTHKLTPVIFADGSAIEIDDKGDLFRVNIISKDLIEAIKESNNEYTILNTGEKGVKQGTLDEYAINLLPYGIYKKDDLPADDTDDIVETEEATIHPLTQREINEYATSLPQDDINDTDDKEERSDTRIEPLSRREIDAYDQLFTEVNDIDYNLKRNFNDCDNQQAGHTDNDVMISQIVRRRLAKRLKESDKYKQRNSAMHGSFALKKRYNSIKDNLDTTQDRIYMSNTRQKNENNLLHNGVMAQARKQATTDV